MTIIVRETILDNNNYRLLSPLLAEYDQTIQELNRQLSLYKVRNCVLIEWMVGWDGIPWINITLCTIG